MGTIIQWLKPEDRPTRFIVKLVAFVCLLAPGICATGAATAKDVVEGDDKPLVMLVFDQNCKAWCSRVKPMMSDLQQEYGDKVMFAQVDATESVWPETKKQVKQLGVTSIFDDLRDYVPVVAVFAPHRKLLKELVGAKSKEDYRANIDKAVNGK